MTDLALLRRLSLSHLATFLAIAETGSFRGAASRLNISQSALSVHIRQLERTLEVQLLYRTTRSVVLSPEGDRLLPVARMLASELAGTARILVEEARAQKRIVRFVTVPLALQSCPPALLDRFCERHPAAVEVRLTIREASALAAEMVFDGEADLGFVYWEPEHDRGEFSPVFYEDFVAVVPAAEPRFAGLDAVTLRDLSTAPVLLQPKGTFMRRVLDRHLERHGIAPGARFSILPADGLVGMVKAGLGVAILASRNLSVLNLEGCRPLRVPEITPRPVGLVIPSNRRASAATIALRDFILDTCRQPKATLTAGGPDPRGCA